VASIGNALGRVFWAWVSDLISRRVTFVVMFLLQVFLFWFLPSVTAVSLMTILTFIVLMCYAVVSAPCLHLPLTILARRRRSNLWFDVDGLGSASAVGPLLIAYMRQNDRLLSRRPSRDCRNYGGSTLLPILVSPPHTGSPTRESNWRGQVGPETDPLGQRLEA